MDKIPTPTFHVSLTPPHDQHAYLALLEELEKQGVPIPRRVLLEAAGLDMFAFGDGLVVLLNHDSCKEFLAADGWCGRCMLYPSPSRRSQTRVPKVLVEKHLHGPRLHSGFCGPNGPITKDTKL